MRFRLDVVLFQFKGFDRYVLTEDEVLTQFLGYVIRKHCPITFFTYLIIKVGGATQVTDLMRRNRQQEFLGPKEHVISVLDGDQQRLDLPIGTYCIPIKNVEAALWDEYQRPGFPHSFSGGEHMDPKQLYRAFTRSKRLSSDEIFDLLCDCHKTEITQFAQTFVSFLCRPN